MTIANTNFSATLAAYIEARAGVFVDGSLPLNFTLAPNPLPAVTSVSARPNIGLQASTVISLASVATAPNNAALTYLWDFGDGVTSTEVTPTHVYNTVGGFIVRVTVSDGKESANNRTSVTIKSMTGRWKWEGSASTFFDLTQSGSRITGTIDDLKSRPTTIGDSSVQIGSPAVRIIIGGFIFQQFTGNPRPDINIVDGMFNDGAPLSITRQ